MRDFLPDAGFPDRGKKANTRNDILSKRRKKPNVPMLILVVFIAALSGAMAAEQDARYKRNGETYLLIGNESVLPAGNIDYRGVWRLNDPEGFFHVSEPQYLIGEVDILDLTVDLYRNINTVSDPKTSAIGEDFKIKRQVIDDGVAALEADKGCHSFIHTDHRTSYWGYGTDVYRTGPAGRGIWGSGSTASKPRFWPGFKSAGPGTETTAPDNPEAYLPRFSSKRLQLGVYPGKKWYEIPNGAWYSSWNHIKGCQYFYQVFADKVTGTRYDWSLVQWQPDTTATLYTRNSEAPFATTYDMQIKRATLAGCFDGCGGASGDESVKTDKMIFSSAFMPMPDKSGKAASRTYFYSRPEGKTSYSITTTGDGSANYLLEGDPVGYETVPDTQWLGVSMKDETSDYLYCLGNSVIKKWIRDGGGNPAGVKISAVTVSNQWNQKGGIVFAFDENEKLVHTFVRNETGAHEYSAYAVGDILSAVGVSPDAKIDDIKADGDGNLFVGMTSPGIDTPPASITRRWTVNDAYAFEKGTLSADERLQDGFLLFRQNFTKSVFRISAMGEPPKEVGRKIIATRFYKRSLSVPPAGWLEIERAEKGNLSGIIASWTSPAGHGSFGKAYRLDARRSTNPDIGRARIAVINVPKPPDVLSLGNDVSCLDIIGAYRGRIPIFNPSKRSTEQNTPSDPLWTGTLDSRTLYFYMVENYPIPTGAQNPKVTPDWDNDGRHGGFISSIINPHPSTDEKNPGTIRYFWRTWMVARQTGKDAAGNPVFTPVCPPEPMSDERTGSYYHYFYSPTGGKFIITCRVDYDWYDYRVVPFGMTMTRFDADPGNARKLGAKAIPTRQGVLHERSTDRLAQIMEMSAFAFMGASKNLYTDTIFGPDDRGNENRDSYAIESAIVVDHPSPPAPFSGDTARIQRCDKAGNDPLTPSHWHPQGPGAIPAPGGFHGIRSGTAYHWRMDAASQAIFFQDLEKAKNEANYEFLATRLTDPMQTEFYVNGDAEFQFGMTGDDLRWAPGSKVEIQADLRFPIPPLVNGKPTVVQRNLAADITKVDSQDFAYITTKGDLSPTDPFEAELVIEMSRLFYYDMRIYKTVDGNRRLLGKVPNLPKRLTITAKARLLIIDTDPPAIAFDRTSPTQLFGLTGRLLEPGTNGNPSSIRFRVTDNNPWDGVSGIPSHENHSPSNGGTNEDIVTHQYGRPQSARYNLEPVFNASNAGVRLSWNVAGMNDNRQISLATNSFMPGYGSFSPGTGLGTPVFAVLKDATTNIPFAALDFDVPLSGLNGGEQMYLPKYYANNTLNYEPYIFRIGARDCSGNKLPDTLLNLALQVKDDIPPDPCAVIQEFKGNTVARFPGSGGLANDDRFESAFRSATAFNPTFVSRGDWLPCAPGINRAGDIMDGPTDTGLRALWPVSETIAALPETMKSSTITPGSILVEDNVEVLMRVAAADNAGAATARLTFRYFDISGNEQTQSTGSSSFSLPGISSDAMTSAPASSRAVFREGSAIRPPLAIPITICATDDARDWDRYSECTISSGTWSWGPVIKGSKAPNKRFFRTTLPVHGSKLTIRTIESGVRSPGR